MSLYEDLSRLLDGDLPPAEAAALWQRIADEPEVAAAWAQLRALPEQLSDLPDLAPPPGLDARVLAAEAPSPGRRAWQLPLAAALALAATLLLLLWPASEPALLLSEGEQWVEGRALVMAGGLPVRVQGRAKISVEPSGSSQRVGGQEVENMDFKHAMAAAAGAAVTVVVLEGRALVSGADGETAVAAGESWSSSPEPRDEHAAPRRVVRRSAAAPADDPEALRERVAELEQELEALEFQGAVQRGRLAAVEGSSQPWPEDLDQALQPSAFQASLDAAVIGREDLELLEVNCDEFPCYAVLRSHSEHPEWAHEVGPAMKDAVIGEAEGDFGLWNAAVASRSDAGELRLVGFSIIPSEQSGDDLRTRLDYRAEGSLTGWMEDLGPEEE